MLDDYPTVQCPQCKAEHADMDGFGFLICGECGYCTHPTSSLHDDGKWYCGLCGEVTD